MKERKKKEKKWYQKKHLPPVVGCWWTADRQASDLVQNLLLRVIEGPRDDVDLADAVWGRAFQRTGEK